MVNYGWRSQPEEQNEIRDETIWRGWGRQRARSGQRGLRRRSPSRWQRRTCTRANGLYLRGHAAHWCNQGTMGRSINASLFRCIRNKFETYQNRKCKNQHHDMMLPVCGLGKCKKASLLIFIAPTHVQFHLSDEQHCGMCYNKALTWMNGNIKKRKRNPIPIDPIIVMVWLSYCI